MEAGTWRNGVMACFVGALLGAVTPATAQDNAAAPGEPSVGPDAPFLGSFLRETRIVYPLRQGAWQAMGEKRFEPQEYGVSVRYMHDKATDRWLDVYFYPAGVLSDERFAQVAERERDLLGQARLQAGDPAPDLGPLRRFDIAGSTPGADGVVRGYSIDMAMQRGDAQYLSAMTLHLDRLYFVKARFSVARGRTSRSQARAMVEAFMAGLVPKLLISSSGACWMPLPIEALGADQPAPEAAMSSSMGEGPANSFLVAGRVLARDPESADAELLMMAGMAQQGRLFPGCDGAEPDNPDVVEGMRELRIEYRAPADSGRGDRLRPATIELGQGERPEQSTADRLQQLASN